VTPSPNSSWKGRGNIHEGRGRVIGLKIGNDKFYDNYDKHYDRLYDTYDTYDRFYDIFDNVRAKNRPRGSMRGVTHLQSIQKIPQVEFMKELETKDEPSVMWGQ
jgi:hypothetical protein